MSRLVAFSGSVYFVPAILTAQYEKAFAYPNP